MSAYSEEEVIAVGGKRWQDLCLIQGLQTGEANEGRSFIQIVCNWLLIYSLNLILKQRGRKLLCRSVMVN